MKTGLVFSTKVFRQKLKSNINKQFNEGWGLHNSQPKKHEPIASCKYNVVARKSYATPLKEGTTTFVQENKTITQKWVNGKCISVEEKLLRKPQRVLRKY